MDFKVGDRVKATVNGEEYQGELKAIGCLGDEAACLVGVKGFLRWFPAWQLTKVEPPKPPESPWLLPIERRCPCGNALAAARHLVEELMRQNDGPSNYALFLRPEKLEDLKRAVGL